MEPKTSVVRQEDIYDSNMIIDEEDEYPQGFRAQPIPAYPDVVPSGLNEHLVRM